MSPQTVSIDAELEEPVDNDQPVNEAATRAVAATGVTAAEFGAGASAGMQRLGEIGLPWRTGDLVIADDGQLWQRANEESVAEGWPWAPPEGSEGSMHESHPPRPLTLLVRDGKPVGGAQIDEAPEVSPEMRCAKCFTPFPGTAYRSHPNQRYARTAYCRACVDNCHDAGDGHRCMICMPRIAP